MSDPARTRTSSSAVAREKTRVEVVFVCAAADEARIATVAEAYRREGAWASLLVGADAEPRRLRVAVVSCERPTLFVLCKSEALSGDAAHALAESFLGHREIPCQWLVVDAQPQRVFGMMKSIRRASSVLAERAHTSRASFECDAWSTSPPVIVASTPADFVGPIPQIVRSVPGTDSSISSRVSDESPEPPEEISDAVLLPMSQATRVGVSPNKTRRWWMWGLAVVLLPPLLVAASSGDEPMALAIDIDPPADEPRLATPYVPPVSQKDRSSLGAPPRPGSDSDPNRRLLALVEQGALVREEHVVATLPHTVRADLWTAQANCEAMSVAEVEGWRLPRRHELEILQMARRLPAGTYWSSSRVSRARAPSHWVMNGRTGNMTDVPNTGEAGWVCVQWRSDLE